MVERYTIDRKTGNIVTARDRKIMQFSVEFFLNKIVKGHHCFVCGEPEGKIKFNDEHIIPKWVTKHFGTEKSHFVLHNGGQMRNSHYTVPCCKNCNTKLSEKLEKRVSTLLKMGYDGLSESIDNDESIYQLLFRWCALIFFKTHYKDQFLPKNRDLRAGNSVIGDLHNWKNLYQVLSVARIHHTDAKVDSDVYGSIIILPRIVGERESMFDYLDHSLSQTMMIQVGEIVIFAVLNDSKACLSFYRSFLSRIDGSITEVQSRELFARLRYANENLQNRPSFTALVNGKGVFTLQAKRSRLLQLYKDQEEKVSLFSLMRLYVGEIVPDLPNREEILTDLENGRVQYILDEYGRFFQY